MENSPVSVALLQRPSRCPYKSAASFTHSLYTEPKWLHTVYSCTGPCVWISHMLVTHVVRHCSHAAYDFSKLPNNCLISIHRLRYRQLIMKLIMSTYCWWERKTLLNKSKSNKWSRLLHDLLIQLINNVEVLSFWLGYFVWITSYLIHSHSGDYVFHSELSTTHCALITGTACSNSKHHLVFALCDIKCEIIWDVRMQSRAIYLL